MLNRSRSPWAKVVGGITMVSEVNDLSRFDKLASGRSRLRALGAAAFVFVQSRWPRYALMLSIFFWMGHFAGAVQKEQQLLKARAIIAEKYELRKADGTLAATLATSAKQQAALSFFDPKGTKRLSVGINNDGSPEILLMGTNGRLRLGMTLDFGKDGPEIVLCDDRGSPEIMLGLTQASGPILSIGKVGRSSVAVNVSKAGTASINVLDDTGNSRISLSNLEDTPEVQLFASKRQVRSAFNAESGRIACTHTLRPEQKGTPHCPDG